MKKKLNKHITKSVMHGHCHARLMDFFPAIEYSLVLISH